MMGAADADPVAVDDPQIEAIARRQFGAICQQVGVPPRDELWAKQGDLYREEARSRLAVERQEAKRQRHLDCVRQFLLLLNAASKTTGVYIDCNDDGYLVVGDGVDDIVDVASGLIIYFDRDNPHLGYWLDGQGAQAIAAQTPIKEGPPRVSRDQLEPAPEKDKCKVTWLGEWHNGPHIFRCQAPAKTEDGYCLNHRAPGKGRGGRGRGKSTESRADPIGCEAP